MRVLICSLLLGFGSACGDTPQAPVPDRGVQAEPNSLALWYTERNRRTQQANRNGDWEEVTTRWRAQHAEWIQLEVVNTAGFATHRLRAQRDGLVSREGASAGWPATKGVKHGEQSSDDYNQMNYLLETLDPQGETREWSYPVTHGLMRTLTWKQPNGEVRTLSDYAAVCPPEVLALMLSVEEAFRRCVWNEDEQPTPNEEDEGG